MANTGTPTCHNETFQETAFWVENGGIIIVMIGIFVCYWGISSVSDQFLIPTLNLICENYNLPDDVAGSTVMAIGMQSSQFFQTIASLYVTKSSIGIGSAIGCGFFNPLCICAGAVLFSKEGAIQLEWRIIVRECLFYLASLLVLLWSLKGNLIQAVYQFVGRQQQLGDCLVVHLQQCIFIISIYGLYIFTIYHYELLVSYFCPIRNIRYDLEFDEQLDTLAPWFSSTGNNEWRGNNNEGNGNGRLMNMSPIIDASTRTTSELTRNNTIVPKSTVDSQYDCLNDEEKDVILKGNSTISGHKNGGYCASGRLLGIDDDNDETDGKNDTIASGLHNMPQFARWTPWTSTVNNKNSGGYFDNFKYFTSINLQIDLDDDRSSSISSTTSSSLNRSGSTSLLEPDIDICAHEFVDEPNKFECYLYKRSKFYSKIRFSQHKWQLRWFTLDHNGFHYCLKREHPGVGVRMVNIFQADEFLVVDEDKFIFKVVIQGRGYEFQATNDDIFSTIVSKIKQQISQYQQHSLPTRVELASKAKAALMIQQKKDFADKEPPTILSLPPSLRNSSMNNSTVVATNSFFDWVGYNTLLCFHYLLFPFKYVLYYTTIDIKQYKYQQDSNCSIIWYAFVSLLICLVWLYGLSTLMIVCLDILARYMGISSSLMGLTFSAVVTSIPSVSASITASRKGMGTLAISNAFGCSLFTVFVGLGLPWFIYILCNNGKPYTNLKDEGIIFTVGILIITILLFLSLMWANLFVLKRWMGVLFVLYYITYVVYAIVFTSTEV